MAGLRIFFAVLMVTVAFSKPISLNDGEDSSKSSESNESSEETNAHVGPSQGPLQPEIDTPAALLPSADSGPSSMLNTSVLLDPEDPQTSTDTEGLELPPDDPSQTALGVDISQDMPDSDQAQDSINADTVHVLPQDSFHPGLPETDTIIGADGTNHSPPTTTTFQEFPKGATPPSPPHVIEPTPPHVSTAAPLPIPIGTTLTGVPVCFTFQFTTAEPDPPRGDSI